MRTLAIGLWVLTAVLVVLWVLFVVWAQGMACAFVTSGNCRFKWPWEMSGEDLRFLILIPATMVAGVAGGAWLVGQGRVGAGLAAVAAGLAVGALSILTLA